MTAVREAVEDDSPEPAEAPQRARLRMPALSRVAARVFVAAVVLLASTFLVEDPLAHVWYQQRQQHLAAQFQTAGRPATGSALAVLQIPSIGVNLTVVQGDTPGVLRSGPGHQPSSPLPGQAGNSVIFGHRKGWGQPFGKLGSVVVGDNIFLQRRTVTTPQSPLFFRVAVVAQASDASRRWFAPSSDHRLTLVTSAPGSGRLIIVAVSGTVAHIGAPIASTSASTGSIGGDVLLPSVWAIACFVIAGFAVVLGRRRHAGRAVAVVTTPLVAAGLLALVLAGDALLRSPLS